MNSDERDVLVCGILHESSAAGAAFAALREAGIPASDVLVHTVQREDSATPAELADEFERQRAGRQTGVVVGGILWGLAGGYIGMLGSSLSDLMNSMPGSAPVSTSWVLRSPLACLLSGALIGLVTGGMFGWIVDRHWIRRAIAAARGAATVEALVAVPGRLANDVEQILRAHGARAVRIARAADGEIPQA